MHRTLKEETSKQAALTLRLQQKKFDHFRQIFNYERPHEGLNNATPGSVSVKFCAPASRSDRVGSSAWVYASQSEQQRRHQLAQRQVIRQRGFQFEVLGFEQTDEDFYKVYFRDVKLASLTRKRLASGRFRSCDEWIIGVNFR